MFSKTKKKNGAKSMGETAANPQRRILDQKAILKGGFGVGSGSHLITLIRDYGFPPPTKFGGANRWFEDEILTWIEQQAAARTAAE